MLSLPKQQKQAKCYSFFFLVQSVPHNHFMDKIRPQTKKKVTIFLIYNEYFTHNKLIPLTTDKYLSKQSGNKKDQNKN